MEVHNFNLGQDVIDAYAKLFREVEIDSPFREYKDFDPDEFVVIVLDDVENDREAISAAITDFGYDEVGAVLLQNGFDLEVYFIQSLYVFDAANSSTFRNEADGNGQIDAYELAHAMTLKNLEVNPGDPMIIKDIILPHTPLFHDTDNIQLDYLFL